MVCLLFSVGSVQSSIQLSAGFRVYSVQCQFSVCSVQDVYCSVGNSPSVLFSVCSVQSTGCSPRVCHIHVMFRVHTLNVLCPCAVQSWKLTSHQQQRVTRGQNTTYQFKNKSTYLSVHNGTRFGTWLFLVGTHWGNLPVSSRFSTEDLNFCVHSIPLWEPCVEKLTGHAQSINTQACWRCTAVVMSMLNLQIHLLWASSWQHECGIKQNKLSAPILPSVMLGWVITFVCTRLLV